MPVASMLERRHEQESGQGTKSGGPINFPRESLIIIPSYGQSLSVGSCGVPYHPIRHPFANRIFTLDRNDGNADARVGLNAASDSDDGVLDVRQIIGLTQLQPRVGFRGYGGQTHQETAAWRLQEAFFGHTHEPRNLCLFSLGRGGKGYRDIKKGTVPYQNLVSATREACEIARRHGLTPYIPAILLLHGETDAGNALYKENVEQLWEDINRDIKDSCGNNNEIMFFMSQPSSFSSHNRNGSHLALYEIAKEKPERFCMVTANYHISQIFNAGPTDFTHLNGTGYALLGEAFGKALSTVLLDGLSWTPVSPRSIQQIDGRTVDIDFNVISSPLVIDVDTPAGDPGHFGFAVTDGTVDLEISDVSLIGDRTVRIRVRDSLPPRGSNRYVEYALRPGQMKPESAHSIPRGCLRDSTRDRSISIPNYTLYNWCIHFREPF